ncbi:MAG: hypothetical protein ACN0LA_11795 [Candidatus Longimicrobiales bacterium M2_2A_002]
MTNRRRILGWTLVFLVLVLIPALILLAQFGLGWTLEPLLDPLSVAVAVLGAATVVVAIYQLARGRTPRKHTLIAFTFGLLLLADGVVQLTLDATGLSRALTLAMAGVVWYGYLSTRSDKRQET